MFTSATAAQAGYSVSTIANTGRGYLRGCQAGYNAGGFTGAKFQVNDGSTGPCNPAGFLSSQGAVVTVSGTTDTTGTATAAHDESSVVALPDAAYATAAADLSTGEVHLLASAASFSSADASAHLADTLHFTIAGASADTVTLIPVSFSFDGKLDGTSNPSTASGELNYGFYFGNAQAYEFGDYGAGYYGYNGTYPTFTYVSDPRVNGWESYSFTSYDPLNTQFTGLYAITGATADISFDFGLELRATNVALDYTNTGKVSIGSVAGVSYTSDSGVFLQAAGVPGAVPEAATWMMMIGGFGLTGGAMRRRRGTPTLRSC
ncbi:PEPxxWA-CTERM sorting domain-containing protein [Sphingomonas nostoxanthinifaciens]|nr:PEPxxWA-CTERM sorting domain-containing protein [Sphingomonas nostoxanthinifaciens]